jgi:hypothetical protein
MFHWKREQAGLLYSTVRLCPVLAGHCHHKFRTLHARIAGPQASLTPFSYHFQAYLAKIYDQPPQLRKWLLLQENVREPC